VCNVCGHSYRYLLIVYAHGANDLSYHASVRTVGLFVAALWLCVGALNVPIMLAHTTKNLIDASNDNFTLTYCGIETRWIAPIFLSFSAFGYAVPLVMIGIIYVTIGRFLHNHRPTTVDQQRARERTSKACRVISLVVVVFGVSWLPYHVNSILAYFNHIPAGNFYEVRISNLLFLMLAKYIHCVSKNFTPFLFAL